ncbi:MAG: hypothetical protein V3T72_19705 [Thermoanaerobaculia bacterium]
MNHLMIRILVPVTVLLLSVPAAAFARTESESRTLTETLTFADPGATHVVEVDNIFGSVTVVGDDGDEVRLSARETISGRSPEDVAEAKRDVELAVVVDGDAIRFIVDGPFRRPDGGIQWQDVDYEVSYDIELTVPRDVDLEVRTVNDGEISIRGVTGSFKVSNVNGGIEMLDVAGGGHVVTVNGGIELRFAENPDAAWSLKTVNGNLRAAFADGLSADMRFKTFNGEVWSDFDSAPRELQRPQPRKRGGHFVYKRDRSFGVRVADGGPELSFDTLNGNIYIRRVNR